MRKYIKGCMGILLAMLITGCAGIDKFYSYQNVGSEWEQIGESSFLLEKGHLSFTAQVKGKWPGREWTGPLGIPIIPHEARGDSIDVVIVVSQTDAKVDFKEVAMVTDRGIPIKSVATKHSDEFKISFNRPEYVPELVTFKFNSVMINDKPVALPDLTVKPISENCYWIGDSFANYFNCEGAKAK